MLMLIDSSGLVIYTATTVIRADSTVSYNLTVLSSPYSSIRVGVGDRLPTAAPVQFDLIVVANSPATRAANFAQFMAAANAAVKLQYLGYQRELLGLTTVTQSPVAEQSMRISASWHPSTAYWTRDGASYAVLP